VQSPPIPSTMTSTYRSHPRLYCIALRRKTLRQPHPRRCVDALSAARRTALRLQSKDERRPSAANALPVVSASSRPSRRRVRRCSRTRWSSGTAYHVRGFGVGVGVESSIHHPFQPRIERSPRVHRGRGRGRDRGRITTVILIPLRDCLSPSTAGHRWAPLIS
jgi:hypothetical protein